MPQTCSICSHQARAQIEVSLIAGMSLSNVAQQFSVSRYAVHRHKQNCMQPHIATVQAQRQVMQADRSERSAWNALDEMQWLRQEARTIYQEVRALSDQRTSLQTLSEIRKQVELFSKLLSGLEQSSQEQLEQEYVMLRDAIFETLESYPDARLAVARALLALKTMQHDAAG